jgi:hypothetical protein
MYAFIIYEHCVKFDVFLAGFMKIDVLCNVTPCILVAHYKRYKGNSCLHPHGRIMLRRMRQYINPKRR